MPHPDYPLPPVVRARWRARAIASGSAASALSAILATLSYQAMPGTADLPWDRLGLAVVLFAAVTGLCLGAGVGFATLTAVRTARGRSARSPIARLVVAGALGGALAGIVPGIMGIAGFGSLHAPYLGTLTIVSSLLAGATAFVVLWAPRLLSASVTAAIHPARRFALSTAAAVITVGSAGLLGGVVAISVQLVPTLHWLKQVCDVVTLPGLAVAGGVILGAAGGAIVGLGCGVFVALSIRSARP